MKEVFINLASSTPAPETTAATVEMSNLITENLLTTNNLWMMTVTFLVFIMHPGFAGVEAGFTQAKNTVYILFKNTLTSASSTIVSGAVAERIKMNGYLIFTMINKSIGLQVSAKHERQGLDSHEQGIRGYIITYE